MEGPIPKKIKLFLWEFSHVCINTANTLIKKAPWLISTLCHKSCETIMHLFGTYEYAHAFWSKLLVFPDDPLILLQVILTGHPFKQGKEIIWNYFVKAFFWLI